MDEEEIVPNSEYLSPEDTAKHFGISMETLFEWQRTGQIKASPADEYGNQLLNKKICYFSVPSEEEESKLSDQSKYFRENYPKHDIIIVDYGCDLERSGLNYVFDSVVREEVSEIVVVDKNSLYPNCFELLEFIFRKHGAKLILGTK